MLVEVPRRDAAVRAEHGDAALVQVAAHAVAREDPRALEARVVVGLGVGDVDLAVHRIDDHVEQDGADAREEPAAPASWRGGLAMASMTNTSLSGSENFTWSLQSRPRSSTQWLPFHLTIELTVSAPATPSTLVAGPGRRAAPNAVGDDVNSVMTVVWLPVWKPAA